jgi:hypothetical protein
MVFSEEDREIRDEEGGRRIMMLLSNGLINT